MFFGILIFFEEMLLTWIQNSLQHNHKSLIFTGQASASTQIAIEFLMESFIV